MSYFKKPGAMGDDSSSTASSTPPSIPDVSPYTGMALVYHGYRRTGSIFWALAYGLLGKEVPAVAVPLALAQGFGHKKPCP